jgi:nucleotide-binding universal stress UspA family protein
VAVTVSPGRLAAVRGYRRLLVPIAANGESERAVDLACRLAADSHASITALAIVEIPAELPLDAHMADVEDEARRLLERVGATGDAYGIKVSPKLVRARDVGAAIVASAASTGAELIVIGAPRGRLRSSNAVVFGGTTEHVLKNAPCRVMLITNQFEAEAA